MVTPLCTLMKKTMSSRRLVWLWHSMSNFSPAVTQILTSLFNFIIIKAFKLNFACISAGNQFPPGTNTDGQIQYLPAPPSHATCWCHWMTEWYSDSRAGQQSGAARRREGCDERPRFHTINYPDITSPVAEDSAGKGQTPGSHKDKLAMHVTDHAGPATALPTSHFRDMTNASTRLLIAPKMPQQFLLTQP